MKRIISRHTFRRLIIEEIDLLLEQEEEEEELFGDEEEEEDTEEGGDEETEEEAEEEAEEEEPEGEEALPLGKSVDDDLNALFVDFETQAIKVGEEQPEIVQKNEGKRKSLSYLLFEQEDEEEVEEGEVEATPVESDIPIDLETFASDVARLAMNYNSLLDMENLIIVKAQDYINAKYGEDKAGELMDILDLRYQLSLEEEEPIVAPVAVGASAAAAAAG